MPLQQSKIRYQGASTLEVLEEAEKYNAWIGESVASYVRAPVLEIGAGHGNISKFLQGISPLTITDVDRALLMQAKKRITQKDVRFDQYDVTKKPKKAYLHFFNSIIAVNVLEHIVDDERGIQNVHSMLRNGGRFICLVPAMRSAYTRLDKHLGHVRRYERYELKAKIEKYHFSIERLSYFNAMGLVSWILRDKIERDHTMLTRRSVSLFDRFVPLLRFIESKFSPPFGISLLCVAKKDRCIQ